MGTKMMIHFDKNGNEIEKPVDRVVPGSRQCVFMCDYEEFRETIPVTVRQTAEKLQAAGKAFIIAAFEPPPFCEYIPVLVPADKNPFVIR